MIRILGIDYGDARVGLSLSDPMGITAQSLETLNEKDMNRVIKHISSIIKEYKVDKVVIGMPKNMDGTIGFRGEKTIEFSERLKKKCNIEIVLWDERLTTISAERMLNEANVRGKKRKKAIDSIAATFILQNYLDSIQ